MEKAKAVMMMAQLPYKLNNSGALTLENAAAKVKPEAVPSNK